MAEFDIDAIVAALNAAALDRAAPLRDRNENLRHALDRVSHIPDATLTERTSAPPLGPFLLMSCSKAPLANAESAFKTPGAAAADRLAGGAHG
ncbi:hypothetical protein [Bradyrhizobium murdochi]|uniref:hypothetical protein n=1 Tax=Bradyrhizobium murdochi TaxID=1038859 RepID=UPI00048BCC67|nr:hypothetical protein [Bradyrhizobium murdochi]